MITVLDVSAAMQILRAGEKGERFNEARAAAERCLAPGLYIYELTNTLRKYQRGGHLSVAECEQYIAAGIKIIDDFIDAAELWREAFALGVKNNHSVYDMYYAALARRHNGTLITNDGDLAKICARENIHYCF
ncbi:MAG: type II toxin-antitoxin system VapC family toxin [Planctomycetota bacterium]|jgi:predicted nucleic acid-binding protein|nr:type II toxin-antitoxin system VapC family toxin [Planctomycetota bacterium]